MHNWILFVIDDQIVEKNMMLKNKLNYTNMI